MTIILNKSIKAICEEIDLIIAGKDNRNDYKYIYLQLEQALTKKITNVEIELICAAILKIATTKNRILRHLEKDFWAFIQKIPLKLILMEKFEIGENEELLSNYDYDNPNKRILSRLVGLIQDVMMLKDDASKGSDLRRAGSLTLLGDLINYYDVPVAKTYFLNSFESKNKDEQMAALEGLENYYVYYDDEIEDEIIDRLDDIISKTDEEDVASTCFQIQVSAGVLDQMSASFQMNDWKDGHYR
jgi:hypothetical protein